MGINEDIQTTHQALTRLVCHPLANVLDTTDYTAQTLRDAMSVSYLDGRIEFKINEWFDATDTDEDQLLTFADGPSSIPGLEITTETIGIRWNNDANPDPIGTSFVVPADMDVTQAATMNFLAFKVGATLGDAVTWTVTAFSVGDGDLQTADADFGGASSAMTGDATTLTCQLETLTLAANTMAIDDVVSITVQPTDGTLGTDDVVLLGVWIDYKKRTS